MCFVRRPAEGVGITPQDAAQNAAENALKNVVGAFIDSNMNLEKKTLIYDGLKSETKNISKDIKEYSQGSIKSFEIIDVKQQAGLYRLTAKVTVRNEQFSAYVKQLATGEVNVGSEIYAKMATSEKQKSSAEQIVLENIIEPILSGGVQEFVVERPMILTEALQEHKLPKMIDMMFRNPDTHQILNDATDKMVTIKILTHLRKEFVDNLNRTLSEISFQSKYIDGKNERDMEVLLKNLSPNVIKIIKNTEPNGSSKLFDIKSSKNLSYPKSKNKSIFINLLNKNNELLRKLNDEEINLLPNIDILLDHNLITTASIEYKKDDYGNTKNFLCNLISYQFNTIFIQEEVECYALLKLDLDVIKNMSKIEVGLE